MTNFEVYHCIHSRQSQIILSHEQLQCSHENVIIAICYKIILFCLFLLWRVSGRLIYLDFLRLWNIFFSYFFSSFLFQPRINRARMSLLKILMIFIFKKYLFPLFFAFTFECYKMNLNLFSYAIESLKQKCCLTVDRWQVESLLKMLSLS
jgi:hypothetical protein